MKFLATLALSLTISASLMAATNLAVKWSPESTKNNTLADMYGKDDLGSFPLFKGGYINFGFWSNLPVEAGKITEKDRIASAEAMYDHIAQKLEIRATDSVAEIGSGLGTGCVRVLTKFYPKTITCVDASPAQTKRAKERHRAFLKNGQEDKLFFVTSGAEKLPFPDDSLNKIYSIEAAQHFDSLEMFITHAHRVLKPGGKIVLTTFFAINDPPSEMLKERLGTVKHGSDKTHSIAAVNRMFKLAGFSAARHYSIGGAVWYGWDGWIKQSEYKNTWAQNWLKAYEDGDLDYVVFTAEKNR